MATDELDDVDRGILRLLQQDARNNTATDIAERVGVTANTVRNRIERLEERGIVKGFTAQVDYERAEYQLQVVVRCSAPVPDRTRLAQEALDIDGVVAVRELMSGTRNVELTIVADEGERVTEAATQIHELGLEIEEEELLKNDYARPFEWDGSDAASE